MTSRKSIFVAVAASLTLAPGFLLAGSASAKDIKCATDEVSIPDERPEGGNLCMKKSEWEKAKGICEANGEKDPMQCVCQDGDSVGACGD